MKYQVGHDLRGYTLEEHLGAGGFGTVYRARQSSVNREVAIKIILPERANLPDFIRRFEAEAQLIARLEHLHIVPLYDYWRDPEGAYLVMRWLRGGSLYDLLKTHGALSIEETVIMIKQIAQALHTAHHNQIIHRDIKPGNILLDEDGNAYLADFGIAKDHTAIDSATASNAILGSLDYLSPEQARGEAVTPQTDIYSLGVVLYEMLIGEHPFPNFTSVERLYKHINDPLPDLVGLDDSISSTVNDIVQKATKKDPAKRFTDVLAMAQALVTATQVESGQIITNTVELLSPREQEVLLHLKDGKTNREIADKLVIEHSTVKWYIKQIYKKLKVRSRVQAIVKARDLDLVVNKSDTSALTDLPDPENPYKGLQAFQTSDAQLFYGRDKLIKKLLSRLQEDVPYKRLLAIVGPSGSGKSSVVKAGLIPALWRGDLPTSNHWYIADMLAGSHPLEELEVALLRIADDRTINLYDHLKRDERGLTRVANLILPDDGSELLIVIDQFEEVFTLVEDEQERQHFLNLLVEAIQNPRSRVRIILTLRADYYDRPLQYPQFGEVLRNRVETILPLSAEELEKTIREPAKLVGVTYEDGLVSRIVSDVHYQPGALPLLQYALTELFERRDSLRLTASAYAEIGGTGGALAKRADEIYAEYDDEGQELIRQVFLRLVTLGEGAEDTRRRANRAELLQITDQLDLVDEIIDIYADSRLLSLDHDPATRRPTVEVAHEAILREWERLRDWLNTSRDDIRQQRQLAQSANEWEKHAQDVSYLLRGIRLEQVETWQAVNQVILTPLERAYIDASIAEHQRAEAEEIERQSREAQLESRSRNILRTLVAVFALATILSGGLGIFAFVQRSDAIDARNDAQINADESQRRALAFASTVALEREEYELALVLGIESAQGDELLPETLRVLDQLAYSLGPRHMVTDEQTCLSYSARDGRLWAIMTDEECAEILIVDVNTLEIVHRLQTPHPERNFGWIEISWDGRLLASARNVEDEDGFHHFMEIWSLETGELLWEYPYSFGSGMWWDFTTDSSMIYTTEGDPEDAGTSFFGGRYLILRDIETYEEIRRYSFEEFYPRLFNYNSDGTLGVASGVSNFLDGSEPVVVVFDTESGEILERYERESDLPHGAFRVGFDPTDSLIWFTAEDGSRSYIIDRTTREDLYVFDGSFNNVPENFGHLVIRTLDGGFWVDIETGQVVDLPVFGAGGYMTSTDRNTFGVHTGSLVQIWDVFGRDAGERMFSDHFEHETNNIAHFTPDGHYIVSAGSGFDSSASFPSQIYLLDRQTGEVVQTYEGHESGIWGADVSADGTMIASGATYDQVVILWNAETGEEIHRLEGLDQWLIENVRFSPDGTHILATSGSVFPTFGYEVPPFVVVWDVDTGEIVQRIEFDFEPPHSGSFYGLYVHPDNERAIVTFVDYYQHPHYQRDQTYLFNWRTGEIIREYDFLGQNSGFAIQQSGDTAFTTLTNYSGTIVEFDIDSGNIVRQWDSGEQDLSYIALSNDGRLLATASGFFSQDSAISLWDVETGELIRRYIDFPKEFFISLEFSPDDLELLVTQQRGQVHILPVTLQSSLDWLLENRYIREFTCSERELYHIEPLCED